MKTIIAGIIVLCIAGTAQASQLLKVVVNRKEQNVYTFSSGFVHGVILTKSCYEYASYDEAALKYDKYSSYDNKIMFSNGHVCDVEKVYSE